MQISYDDSKEFWSKQEIRNNTPHWLQGIGDKKPESHWKPLANYLYYMMERLEACKRVLKPTGSIYLHCDWRASSYLRMVMDEVFGYENFRNEIIWCYSGGGVPKKDYPRKHDIILRYSKAKNFVFNVKYKAYSESTKKGGKHFDGSPLRKEGTPITDWWTDIFPASGWAKENTGYPTQKPEALLERIIKASSNNGDTVLDPFCGCGTTIVAAHKLGRKWIGIDSKEEAFKVIKKRVSKMGLTQGKLDFKIEYPSFEINQETLMKMNGKEFEKWVNNMCDAKSPTHDLGVDGIMEDGTPIQTKTSKVKYDVISQLLTDAESHSEVSNPLKKIRVVSREGFDESAWEKAEWIKRNKEIKVELVTAEDLLNVNKTEKTTNLLKQVPLH